MKKKIEDCIGKKVAIECKTIEEFNNIKQLLLKAGLDRNDCYFGDLGFSLGLDKENIFNGFTLIDNYKTLDYTIYPASDFLEKEIEMLPYPEHQNYFKAVVTKDIHREDISTNGSIPKLIPKGYQTWFLDDHINKYRILNKTYTDRILNKTYTVYPEDNRWYANIPAEYFEIVDDTSKPDFVLPENWCIAVTSESKEFIKKYRISIDYQPYDITETKWNYQDKDCGCNFYGRIEITLEQFKKYVLKEMTDDVLKVENLIEGEIYSTTINNGLTIFKCNKKSSNKNIVCGYSWLFDSYYNFNTGAWIINKTLKLATFEEKEHFLACEKAGKYVSKEDIKKEVMEQEKTHKFKKGDKVKFIQATSRNARYFRKGLLGLEIKDYEYFNGRIMKYHVYESDKSTSWLVDEDELTFIDSSQYKHQGYDNGKKMKGVVKINNNCSALGLIYRVTWENDSSNSYGIKDLQLFSDNSTITSSSKDSLLSIAKAKYPKGTYYLSVDNNTKQEVKGEFKFYPKEGYITDGWGGYIYGKGKWAKIVDSSYVSSSEQKISNSREEILLEEAKRRYPIGTIVKKMPSNVGGDFGYQIRFIKHSYCKNPEQLYVDNNLLIYTDGVWAEIQSLPENVKDDDEPDMSYYFEECKKRYPIGTIFDSLGGNKKVEVTKNTIFSINGSTIEGSSFKSHATAVMYRKLSNEWAKIISSSDVFQQYPETPLISKQKTITLIPLTLPKPVKVFSREEGYF